MISPVVLLTDNDLGDRQLERQLLLDNLPRVDVVIADCSTEADVLAAVEACNPHAIVTQWAPISDAVFELAPRCIVVSRIGIGIDMIDVDAAARRRVAVRNVPHYCTEEVATHAVALALALWRNIPQFDADVRRGEWKASSAAAGIGRLSQATIALVGAGSIGSLVARAFAPWGSRIIVHDPAPAEDAYPRVSLDEVAKNADLISVHAPLNKHTHHIIDAAFLDQCERSPILINTSRGGLVDLEAVDAAILGGALRGAGLDVFETEPLDSTHQILSNPKVLVTPHAAWCSRDALPELRTQAIMNVVNALRQEAE